jgi:hypothetical protein
MYTFLFLSYFVWIIIIGVKRTDFAVEAYFKLMANTHHIFTLHYWTLFFRSVNAKQAAGFSFF